LLIADVCWCCCHDAAARVFGPSSAASVYTSSDGGSRRRPAECWFVLHSLLLLAGTTHSPQWTHFSTEVAQPFARISKECVVSCSQFCGKYALMGAAAFLPHFTQLAPSYFELLKSPMKEIRLPIIASLPDLILGFGAAFSPLMEQYGLKQLILNNARNSSDSVLFLPALHGLIALVRAGGQQLFVCLVGYCVRRCKSRVWCCVGPDSIVQDFPTILEIVVPLLKHETEVERGIKWKSINMTEGVRDLAAVIFARMILRGSPSIPDLVLSSSSLLLLLLRSSGVLLKLISTCSSLCLCSHR